MARSSGKSWLWAMALLVVGAACIMLQAQITGNPKCPNPGPGICNTQALCVNGNCPPLPNSFCTLVVGTIQGHLAVAIGQTTNYTVTGDSATRQEQTCAVHCNPATNLCDNANPDPCQNVGDPTNVGTTKEFKAVQNAQGELKTSGEFIAGMTPGIFNVVATVSPSSAGLCPNTAGADTPALPVYVTKLSLISVDGMFYLGNSATVSYKIEPASSHIVSGTLKVYNKSDVLVYQQDLTAKTGGNHTITWANGKWNTAHANAFANPKNGPYKVKIVWSTDDGALVTSNELATTTKLKIQCDVRDEAPSGITPPPIRVAGLSDIAEVLKVQVKKGTTIVELSGASLFSGYCPGNNEPTVYVRHMQSEAPTLQTLDDGDWEVSLKDFRDAIGNFADNDNDPSNGVQPLVIGTISLY
ncbi:MAG: hypothetical protein ACYC26_17785 [Phycisphaerales bacterium]